MHSYSVTFITLSILSSFINALPAAWSTQQSVQGATYFITNRANNTIFVSQINHNGTLSFAQEVPTGGAGGSASGGPDALFCQDSIIQKDGLLFAVNPGDNTVSAFAIDRRDPTNLTMLGTPANTLGEFPVAVAYSKKHGTACVVNSGGQANIACFSVSKQGLEPISNSIRDLGVNQTNPPTGPANTVSDIIFNQDESQLLVSVKGTPNGTVGFIANFPVTSGSPFNLGSTPVKSTPENGVLPFSMTLVGDRGDTILNTDAAFGVSVSNFDPDTGAIINSTSVAIQNQTATCWSSYSERTESFYVTDVGNNRVSQFVVDSNGPTAQLAGVITLSGSGGRIDQNIASLKDSDFLYVLDPKDGLVSVVKLVGFGAGEIQAFDAQAAVPDLPVSIQGMAVFVR